ncbi:CCR4-NOT core DEDD RNase subunit, partial [Coemansia sp. RSA 2703]
MTGRAIPEIVASPPSEKAVANFWGEMTIMGSDMKAIRKQNSASTAQPAKPTQRWMSVRPNHSPCVVICGSGWRSPRAKLEKAEPVDEARFVAPSRRPLKKREGPLEELVPSVGVLGSRCAAGDDDDDVLRPARANLEEEVAAIRRLIGRYPYVAMDTEFPGVVARPIGQFASTSDYHYQLLRCNVDMLNIIQLGITLMDAQGKAPPGVCSWQFNFKFRLGSDMYAQESIDLLTKSGIDFLRHAEYGVDAFHFGELLTDSGLVLMKDVRWVSFHSGYDFGYLLKLLTCAALPEDEDGFFSVLHTFFPGIFDI